MSFLFQMDTPTSPEAPGFIMKDECNFIQNVSQFYNQQALSDVVLKIDDDTYYSHKFVLAKSSDVFRTMLYESPWTQSTSKEVELSETPECRAVFDRFLRFLYTAEISINTEAAVGILCLADKYNVNSLKCLCTKYMVQHTKSPKVRNALTWYSWAKGLHLQDLINQCSKTIAWNTETILNSAEWLAMDIDFVYDILNKEELVVMNEYVLYNGLVKWLLSEGHVEEFSKNALKLLPLIRFPQMMVHQLFEIESSDISQKEECKDILKDLIGQAYRFRSLCPSQNSLNISFHKKFYLPRNYMDLAVDTVRMQNSLRFGIQVDVRTYAGPVPTDAREGDWKITYRKTNDCWTLQLICHESAMINGEARIQASVLMYNEEEKVVQVEQVPTFICSRGNNLSITINVDSPDDVKMMVMLIKPVPY